MRYGVERRVGWYIVQMRIVGTGCLCVGSGVWYGGGEGGMAVLWEPLWIRRLREWYCPSSSPLSRYGEENLWKERRYRVKRNKGGGKRNNSRVMEFSLSPSLLPKTHTHTHIHTYSNPPNPILQNQKNPKTKPTLFPRD